ncbi:MAG TPA: cytochrome c-type biogenesis protein [Longimicrobiales bacterium]
MLLALALAFAMQATAHTAPPAAPYDSALEARVAEVSSILRCPVCQGLSIQDSPSELSLQMKDVVRQQLREGKSPEEVKAYFVSKYGEWILLEPKASGMNLLVYIAPLLLLLAGGVVIWFAIRKWSAAPASASEAPVDEEEELTV